MLVHPPDQDNPHMPTTALLNIDRTMSIHQLGAFTTLSIALRVLHTGKPDSLASMFTPTLNRRTGVTQYQLPKFTLNVALEGFHNQATRLLNMIPGDIRLEANKITRKRLLKSWVLETIVQQV